MPVIPRPTVVPRGCALRKGIPLTGQPKHALLFTDVSRNLAVPIPNGFETGACLALITLVASITASWHGVLLHPPALIIEQWTTKN